MAGRIIDLWPLLPIASVVLGALAIGLIDALLVPNRRASDAASPGRASGVVMTLLGTVALVGAAVLAWSNFASGAEGPFDSSRAMLRIDAFVNLSTVVVSVSALLSFWLATAHAFAKRRTPGDAQALILLATVGLLALVASADLIVSYVGIEIAALALHASCFFGADRGRSSEAALKSFVTGGFGSSILVFGFVLLYGATGSTDFERMVASGMLDTPLAWAGFGLAIAGLGCKLAAVPFHSWAPDLVDGSPPWVGSFVFATAVPAVALSAPRLLALQPHQLADRSSQAIAMMAILGLIMPAAMAWLQTEVKRMLAYASIANGAFALAAVAIGSADARIALLFLPLGSMFAIAGAFAVLHALERDGEPCRRVSDLLGLADRRSGLAGAFALFLIAIVGLPGTGPFIAKFLLLASAADVGGVAVVLAGVISMLLLVTSAGRVIANLYMTDDEVAEELRTADPDEDRPTPEMSSLDIGILCVCAAAVVYLGILPSFAPLREAADGVWRPSASAQDPNVAVPARHMQFVE